MKTYLLLLFTVTNLVFNQDDIDDYIMDKMDIGHIPGLAASVIKDGRIIWTGTYGYANLEEEIPITENTNFMLASISKTITATAIMQLYEQGQLSLDNNINDFLPFPVINPNYPEVEITNYMIMTHTNGIVDDWAILDGLSFGAGEPLDLDLFLYDYLYPLGEYYSVSHYLNFSPGSNWSYSNVGFSLNALITENITGQTFEDYCIDNIFNPLEMETTSWHLEGLNEENIAIPYEWWGGELLPLGNYWIPDYPSGQLRSSINELSNFLISYMQGGTFNSNTILDSSTINYMLTEHIDDGWAGMSNGWGLGWYYKIQDGRTLWGHNGWMFGVLTEMFYDSEQDLGVIILTNGGDYYSYISYNQMIDIENQLFDYAEAYVSLQGDVNEDTIIDILDIIMVTNYILNLLEPSPYQFNAADMNDNDLINILDLILLIDIIID